MELGESLLGGRAGEQTGAAPQVLRHDLQLGLQGRSQALQIFENIWQFFVNLLKVAITGQAFQIGQVRQHQARLQD